MKHIQSGISTKMLRQNSHGLLDALVRKILCLRENVYTLFNASTMTRISQNSYHMIEKWAEILSV